MAAITLEDIRKAADKKFAPVEFDLQDGKAPVRIKNALRLPKELRTEVTTGLQDALKEEGADLFDVVSEVFKKIAEKPSDASRIIDATDGDAAVLLQFLNSWQEGQGVGEASASQD